MDTVIHKGDNCFFVASSPADNATSAAAKSTINKNPSLQNHKKTAKHRQTVTFNSPVYIIGQGTSVGTKEGKGPLAKYFKQKTADDKMGEKSFERAEIKMLKNSVTEAVKSSGQPKSNIDLFLGGDLLNQITSSTFAARDLGIPYVGLYSACATMASCLALGAILVDGGFYNTVACATASHFATAERQYRYPLEYGCQRPPYAQWTVTGAGCSILSSQGVGPQITSAILGRVVDFGTDDLNNMGAAMAPENAIIPPYKLSVVLNLDDKYGDQYYKINIINIKNTV